MGKAFFLFQPFANIIIPYHEYNTHTLKQVFAVEDFIFIDGHSPPPTGANSIHPRKSGGAKSGQWLNNLIVWSFPCKFG
jgi:hypothetical protein